MRRFERIYDVVEPVEEYRPGDYHPVHLHDVFNQRYEVLGKLAYGQFSTVWLARDQRLQRDVALKILKADSSKDCQELAILLCISDPGVSHPGKKHVLNLLDRFEHDGPNGTHLCLVSPVMMSDGGMMTVRRKPRHASYVRAISKQILLGVDFLHGLGIVHCDLQPANILFSAGGDTSSGVSLQLPEYSPVRWIEGVNVSESAPRYLVTSQRSRGVLDDAEFSTLLVKIGDLGGATWGAHSDKVPVTPMALRAPELFYQNHWDAKMDVWTLGCLIFQLATNEALFPLGLFGLTKEQINEEHENLIRKIIGNDDAMHTGFSAYLSERLPSNFAIEDRQRLASFLRSMLQQDPRARKSTTELLKHPFLDGDGCDEETREKYYDGYGS